MSLARIRKPTLIVLSLLLALAVLSLAPQPAAPTSGGNAIALKAPSFVRVANAQDAPDATPMGFPQDEAGISAYFKSALPVTLADVRSAFRTIESETADFILGSVPVSGYPKSHDVHVYVHKDGWFLAYYLSEDPVGRIFDWVQYGQGDKRTVPTMLETTLAVVTGMAGVPLSAATCYDFRYPSATHLMLIADNRSSFQVKLPSVYNYYHRSWSLLCTDSWNGGSWTLDGNLIKMSQDTSSNVAGTLTGAQLLPDTFHTVSIGYAYGGLALIYRVP